ncbi:hypothetical protein FH972_022531 [Carpinus fangiana]|uniref:MARVEL domain-containing protein n=1 Tax=Carpinus fangiana TaxID=176857 RepID=A0A5N6KSH7_9ROSI|nr:hypothetical protein FH972_022531 [Carpinus fangiana]
MQIIQLPLRGAQFLFCLPVLGITAALVKGHGPYGLAAITDYVLFCAIFGIITSILGVVAAFITSLQGLVILAFDALAVLFFLASSIALAVQTGVASCDPGLEDTAEGKEKGLPYRLWKSGMISNGYYTHDGGRYGNGQWIPPYSDFVSRCRMSQANDAFLFFALAVFMGSLVFDIFTGRKVKRGSAA